MAETSTQNPNAGVVSLGSNGFYQKPGTTYFEMPDSIYQTLQNAGREYVEALNTQFIAQQIAQGKAFTITIGQNGMGSGTQLEIDLLRHNPLYYELYPEKLFFSVGE